MKDLRNHNILVVGSSNTDMVVKTNHLPRPGETVLGGTFFTEDPPFLTSSFCTSGIFLLLSLFVLFFSAVFGHPRACALLFPQVLVTMGEIVKKEVNHGWI